jgi:hypothetical protein
MRQHNRPRLTFSTSHFRRNDAGDVALTLPWRYARRRVTAVRRARRQANEGRMTTFDKREEGFEKKFAHDEELKFKAVARRNKLMGLWAAGELGKTGPDADAYAKEIVMADFEAAGEGDVVGKLVKDLAGKATEPQIRAKMNELLAQAIDQVKKSG